MKFSQLRRVILVATITIIIVALNYYMEIVESPILAVAIAVIALPVISMAYDLVLGKRPGIITFIEEIYSEPNYLQILLKKVEASWLNQFLEPTLSRATFFVPFTEFNQDNIRKNQLPIDGDSKINLIKPNQKEDQALQEEHEALQNAVTNSGHQMLILGEQGVGKTIIMLKILRWAVQVCSEENRWNSVPVVLNLSTWNVGKESFNQWVVNQLRFKYQLPAGIAQQVFDNRQLFLFLDGLDEVRAIEDYDDWVNDATPENARLDISVAPESSDSGNRLRKIDQVIKEFNEYMEDRVGLDVSKDKRIRFVICCRMETYQALHVKPLAAGGIILHKLSQEQVLDQVGNADDNNNLLELMLEENDIVEKARIPYQLNVMLKTFKDGQYAKSAILISCRDDNALFYDYVRTRLEMNPIRDYGSDEKVIYWLSTLAQHMKLYGSEEFLIEELQPHMLLEGKGKRLYQFLFLSTLTFFLLITIALPLSTALIYEWFYHEGLDKAIVIGREIVFYSIIIVLVGTPLAFGFGSMAQDFKGGPIQTGNFFQSIYRTIERSVKNRGWLFGVLIAAFFGVMRGFTRWYSFPFDDTTLVDALINFGVTFTAVLFGFIWLTGKEMWYESINTVRLADSREWNSRRAINGSVAGLGVGVIFLIIPAIYTTITANIEDLRLALARGISIGAALTVCFAILFGLTGPSRRMKINTKANEGIYQLLKNAFLSYTVLSIVGVIALGLGYGLLLGRPDAEVNAILGLILGILSLGFGLLSVFRHACVRLVLVLQKRSPLNIAKFLDYTSQLTLTRKVGGRYLFEHSFLIEYFQRRYSELIEERKV
ncbi:hypothetical protein GC175_20460 [bacterium]|nr:hypothetical protein [bacterium]